MKQQQGNVAPMPSGGPAEHKGTVANATSCVGCKFLYSQDMGYSNWTVTDTQMRCALQLNPNLPADEPFDWDRDNDNWTATKHGRCKRYAAGVEVHLDVDGDDGPETFTNDEGAIVAICADAGIGRKGEEP